MATPGGIRSRSPRRESQKPSPTAERFSAAPAPAITLTGPSRAPTAPLPARSPQPSFDGVVSYELGDKQTQPIGRNRSRHIFFGVLRLRPLRRVLRIAQRHLEIHALAPAENGHRHGIACMFSVHRSGKVLRIRNHLAIKGHDQIAAKHYRHIPLVSLLGAAMQSSFLRRAARKNTLDQDAVVSRKPNLLGCI